MTDSQDLDRGEHVSVELVPRDRVRDLIHGGTINHSQVLAALYLLGLDA